MLAARYDGLQIDLGLLRHSGKGSRPYLPATNKLTERKKATTISVGVKGSDWQARLEHERSTHTGGGAIINATYAAIVGGFGPFENRREEEKWSISGSFAVNKDVEVDVSFYYTDRRDRQYNHPGHDYVERGGALTLRFDL